MCFVFLPSNHFPLCFSFSDWFSGKISLTFTLWFPGDRGGSRRVEGRNFSASTETLFSLPFFPSQLPWSTQFLQQPPSITILHESPLTPPVFFPSPLSRWWCSCSCSCSSLFSASSSCFWFIYEFLWIFVFLVLETGKGLSFVFFFEILVFLCLIGFSGNWVIAVLMHEVELVMNGTCSVGWGLVMVDNLRLIFLFLIFISGFWWSCLNFLVDFWFGP